MRFELLNEMSLHQKKGRSLPRRPFASRVTVDHEQPLVDPQVSHFMQVPLRTMV